MRHSRDASLSWGDEMPLYLPGREAIPLPSSNWLDHLMFVHYLLARLRPRRIVEVGVFTGASLLLMRALADFHGIDCELCGIDPWAGDNGGVESWRWDGDMTYKTLSLRCAPYPNVRLLRCTGDVGAHAFDDDSIDLIHIDADHREGAIRDDLGTWLPKLAPNGVVLMHDVCNFTKVCEVWRVWGELTDRYPAWTDVRSSGLGAFAPKGVPSGLADLLRIY